MILWRDHFFAKMVAAPNMVMYLDFGTWALEAEMDFAAPLGDTLLFGHLLPEL